MGQLLKQAPPQHSPGPPPGPQPAPSWSPGPQRPHHALSPKKVGDHFFMQVVHKASRALVVAAAVDEELLPGVLIDEGADLVGEMRQEGKLFFVEVEFT